MSIRVALEHRTTYRFARPVEVAPHVVRLRPAPHTRTPVESYSLTVEPAAHFLNWQQDPFGNWQARLVFPEKTDTLSVTVGLVADLMVINPFDFFVEESAETFPFTYDAGTAADLAPYLRPVDGAADVDAWRSGLPGAAPGEDGVPTVQFLADLNRAVNERIAYSVRMEAGVQDPDETLARGIGSCRDSAWLLVAALRQHGLAARFVSGYLVQLAPDQAPLEGPAGPTADFTDLHAWTEVFLPGAGWVGLDPTSALFAGEGHIPLSATPHPSRAAPIEGATEPVEVTFEFANTVRRLDGPPRTTRPYSEAEWTAIDALGRAVDERLVRGDVRLTMGGEPTFVALGTDPAADTPQWSTDADGPEKRAAADRLAARLRERYAAGGVVHRGQGKWYPGEPLPRWTIALQWRSDGVPLWQDSTLFAEPWGEPAPGRDAVADAEALARRVTRVLGLPESHLLGAFEDPLAELATAVRRPAGEPLDPTAAADALDTDGVAALDATETTPTGWVLPLVTGEEWTSPAWRFRRGRLVLTPGTSPVGLRLPLDAIAWTPPGSTGSASYVEAGPPLEPRVPVVTVVDPEGVPTTALTVEAREGHVHVFLPPTERLEDYADLLRLVEVATRRVGCPIVLEGYGPPPDARLTQLVVTPDPGVVEVNVQPSADWAQLRELTLDLHDEARAVGLVAEKFDLDGTHTGTGGGNHLTLGGAQPVDSPLLRRPELLASIVAFWQRHPSLSYLFSGRFVGPTSQAPRFDEGRPEAVYEMEIALAELARLTHEHGGARGASAGDDDPLPWLVDRALRHLLTDLTGNTHRAELCVDKLYSPDSSRGRLGLLELRGFEMPPHPQLALVQALLVRCLVARFWEAPYDAPLVRWGTRLHDDLLLPDPVLADAAAVVADLRAHGLAFEEAWLAPFGEFRFPRLGRVTVGAGPAGAVELELRRAVEPWNVLGEEATAGGTARYVDSSLERLQVSARGFDPERHLVTCQGVPVPLAPSPVEPGAWFAGVRYRAWQPWSALHPSIGVHAPLHLDVVELSGGPQGAARGTSVGGATYHVVHPGGRAYEHAPVNAAEAEARRASRFEPRAPTGVAVDVAAARARGRRAASADYPRTLDLRRAPSASSVPGDRS